ncbi:hypothetical protein P3TCK_26435 [Photobacterium profundum 3TCK]|uniref:Uncharacterized protein n=1 Tax=Photobacterium profundum 3TCK TaxID=314280 RepID=Q1Z215_9GAMM|nr:hypothetical protein P3TCK_26435 [Photobacterium profundum 3TCK]
MKTVSLFNLVTKAAITIFKMMVEGEGFEPSKAEPSDLQSDPFGHSGIPPRDLSVCFLQTVFQQAVCDENRFVVQPCDKDCDNHFQNDGGGRRIRTFEGGAVRFTI